VWELLPRIYAELRELAGRIMVDERTGHTLQPTALVHEAWAKLAHNGLDRHVRDRRHLLALTARAMRQVLVDHARARAAAKRGHRVEVDLEIFDQWIADMRERSIDVIDLNEAVERLAGMDAELARLIDLRFFAGLSIAETAESLGVSESTIERGWRTARAWLQCELERASA
jgi:RNA polymerase sigma factor (TIGR02999 family)